MGALSVIKVLDALKTEIEMQLKRGDKSGKATNKAICDRLKNEDLSLKESSIPVQVTRYLKEAYEEGYVEREKIGRNAFYNITPAGTTHLIQNQDLLDNTNKWFEEPSKYGYMSYAVSKREWGLIQERRNEPFKLNGKEEIEKLIRIIKKNNPGVKSIYIRLDKENTRN